MPDTTINVSVDASSLKARLDGVTKANREERLRREREGLTQDQIENELGKIDAGADAGGGRDADGQLVDGNGRRRSGSVNTWKRLDPAAQRGGYQVAIGWVDRNGATYTVLSGDGTAEASVTLETPTPTTTYTGTGDAFTLDGLPTDEDGPIYVVTGAGSYPDQEAGGGGIYDNDTPGTLYQSRYQEISRSISSAGEYILPVGKDLLIYVAVESASSWSLRQYGAFTQDPDLSLDFKHEEVAVTESWDTACFLIGRTTARAITAPAGLVSALRRLHPLPPSAPETDTGNAGSINLGRLESGDPLLDFTVTIKNYSSAQEEAISPLDSVIDISLLRQDGIGYLGSNAHQGDYGTPSVFGFLTDTRAVSSYPERVRYYADVPANLAGTWTGGRPPKYLGECVLATSCPTGFLDFDVTSTAPTDYYLAMDEALFARSQVKRITIPDIDPGYNRIAAWDWGRPGLCSAQLIALGFTTADLTP
jgi:hypothetical protein